MYLLENLQMRLERAFAKLVINNAVITRSPYREPVTEQSENSGERNAGKRVGDSLSKWNSWHRENYRSHTVRLETFPNRNFCSKHKHILQCDVKC